MRDGRVAISCLLDNDPVFFMQAWNWLCSLRSRGTFERADVYVHYVDEIDPARLLSYEALGATLVSVRRFGSGDAAYCNKVRQLETPALADYDYVILSDTDFAFAQCPTILAGGSRVRAKLVDADNPPEPIWRALTAEAGLEARVRLVPLGLRPQTNTFHTNLNGGLYVLPGAHWKVIADSWPKWARFCLDRSGLLGDHANHSDQLGFGLALLADDIPVEHLGLEANFPLHLRASHSALSPVELIGIHYHRELDNHGLIELGGIEWIDEQVREVNSGMVRARRTGAGTFDNKIFWDFRYRADPERGSGLGSRGETLKLKRRLLLPYFRIFADNRVLDVGCGDLETTRLMPARTYHGIDISPEALRIARAKRPDWHFDSSELADLPDDAYDLALCLDVALHQSDPQTVRSLVSNLARVASQAVIVSGAVSAPEETGIVFAGEPMDELLASQPGIATVVRLGSYRGLELLLGIRNDTASPHDIELPDLAYGMSLTPDWELLAELVAMSRRMLGFFPRTTIRTIEYPWFARRLANHAGERVLDIGAGVCVLPLWLAEHGCDVTTVDYHPVERDDSTKDRWNEWGYLDYARLDPRIQSHRVDAAHFESSEPFDAICSVSVLEHTPANTRRAIFERIAEQLAPDGRVYLSFDLVPGTRDLWALSEGEQVEDPSIHGTYDDILAELRTVGLDVTETTTGTGIRDSRTDLVMIAARPTR